MKAVTIRAQSVVSIFILASLLTLGSPQKTLAQAPAPTAIKSPDLAGATVTTAPAAGPYNTLTGATPPSPSSPGEVTLSASTYIGKEGTVRKIVVKRVYGSKGTISVGYITKAKTALAGKDFILKTGTLTWLNGDTTVRTIKVPIIQDGLAESNEVFQLVLRTPVNTLFIPPYKANVTIPSNAAVVAAAALASSAPLTSAALQVPTQSAEGAGSLWDAVAATFLPSEEPEDAGGEDAD